MARSDTFRALGEGGKGIGPRPGRRLGHHDLSLSTLEKLAKALKVKVGELLE